MDILTFTPTHRSLDTSKRETRGQGKLIDLAWPERERLTLLSYKSYTHTKTYQYQHLHTFASKKLEWVFEGWLGQARREAVL